MSLGYMYMALALASFSLLGIFAKVADTKACRPSAIYALLFFWSLVLVSFFVVVFKHADFHAPASVHWIAVPFGISGALGGLAFQTGLRYGRISTSWLIINLSAAIPTLGSVVFYSEPISARRVGLLFMIGLSIFLLWKDKESEEARTPNRSLSVDESAKK